MIQRAAPDRDLLEVAQQLQSVHAAAQDLDAKKARGQFFTPAPVARLMASMIREFPEAVRVLDPGAGAGMLSAAVCERVLNLRTARTVEIHAYETDRRVVPLLDRTLSACATRLASQGHSLRFTIHETDFVLGGPGQTGSGGLFSDEGFDIAILNPPYLKLSKQSPYAIAMADLVHGQPNIYALFMARAASCLAPGGRIVSITPRSFCNGPYFRAFRRWFLDAVTVDQFHLFGSRTDTFADSEVLQESVILSGRRGGQARPTIRLSHSTGSPNVNAEELECKPSFVVRGSDRIIRLPSSRLEISIMRAVEAWPNRFARLGLRVSTGPIVLFRSADHVRRGEIEAGAIPLLSIQNVRPYETAWPSRTAAKTLSFVVSDEVSKLLVPSSNYVLLRRFSAKEEAKRLVASSLFRGAFGCEAFAIENHLNYVSHADRSLSRYETIGLTAVFNSRLLDLYFRTISGCTQVNAAEVREMPLPDLEAIAEIGRELDKGGVLNPAERDSIVLDILGVHGSLRNQLAEGTDQAGVLDAEVSRTAAGSAE